MSEKLQSVKGMNDVLPPDSAKAAYVEERARRWLELAGFRAIATPIAEYTELFRRGIGEATDIVEKEMYTFADRDGRSLTLRPEGTAGAARAYVEHAFAQRDAIQRWYYIGPMFRHERMQRGRYRQFHQIGGEVFGVEEPSLDAEIIALVDGLLRDLGIDDFVMAVNSIGTAEDRPAYRAALVSYFEQRVDQLCADCRRRLATNPMRILDCKVPGCRAAAAEAPTPIDHLGARSRAAVDTVRRSLDALGVHHEIDPRLVRGLDYYTGVVFEARTRADALGAQNALGGGGRYDGLVAELGGAPTPAVGFSMGLERLLLTMPRAAETFVRPVDVFFVSEGDAAKDLALATAGALRRAGHAAEVDHRRASFKSQLKRADRVGARLVVLCGAPEMEARRVKLKDMRSSEQTEVSFDGLASALISRLKG